MKARPARPLSLRGLRTAPSQVRGAIRLVPLLRDRPRADLRLGLRRLREDLGVVALDRSPDDLLREGGLAYCSYLPHAALVRWSDDGAPVAAFGGRLLGPADRTLRLPGFRLGLHHRMARRTGDVLRFFPYHLAVEHFLAVTFAGPDVRWPEWTRRALDHGLDPRAESFVGGHALDGLAEALRTFELHDGQVGLALFVSDALAALSVAPHPEDWRVAHGALLDGLYGELVAHHARIGAAPGRLVDGLDEARVTDLGSLRAEVARARLAWADAHRLLLGDVLGRPVIRRVVQRMGPFALDRFHTALDRDADAHVGESITTGDGEVLYLQTVRLSKLQTRRAHLLHTLAANDWHLGEAARALRSTPEQLVERLERAELGWMVRPELRRAPRA